MAHGVAPVEECCDNPDAGREFCELPSKARSQITGSAYSCPRCNAPGKRIDTATVKALLDKSLRLVTGSEYLFCRTETCPVVYFSSDGQSTFRATDIRVPVFQKEPRNPNVPVCYCFRHTVGEILGSSQSDQAAILKDIETGIDVGQCACDLRNPQGSCCLGNVRALLKSLRTESIPAA